MTGLSNTGMYVCTVQYLVVAGSNTVIGRRELEQS